MLPRSGASGGVRAHGEAPVRAADADRVAVWALCSVCRMPVGVCPGPGAAWRGRRRSRSARRASARVAVERRYWASAPSPGMRLPVPGLPLRGPERAARLSALTCNPQTGDFAPTSRGQPGAAHGPALSPGGVGTPPGPVPPPAGNEAAVSPGPPSTNPKPQSRRQADPRPHASVVTPFRTERTEGRTATHSGSTYTSAAQESRHPGQLLLTVGIRRTTLGVPEERASRWLGSRPMPCDGRRRSQDPGGQRVERSAARGAGGGERDEECA